MDSESKLPESAKKVFQGVTYSVWQWEQKLYDGTTAIFEGLKRPHTVNVVGILPDERILLIRDEQPHRKAVITPAGGRVEEGEEIELAARREMLEETGYTVGELTPWYDYSPLGQKVDWSVYVFIGQNLQKTQKQALEGGERVELLEFSFDKFLELSESKELRDPIFRLKLLEARLDPQKKAKLHTLLFGE